MNYSLVMQDRSKSLERNQQIISDKLDNPDMSYSQLGKKYNVSKQRIHQILKRAIRKV